MIKDLLGIVLWTLLIKVELLVELCYQTLVPVLQIFQREKFLALFCEGLTVFSRRLEFRFSVSPQSRSLFSASFRTFCLTAFCSLSRSGPAFPAKRHATCSNMASSIEHDLVSAVEHEIGCAICYEDFEEPKCLPN